MLSEIILEQVSDAIDESELDVLIAIGESYSKYFSMLCEMDNEDIIQESFVFMEDGESSSVWDKLKGLFTKAIQYIKAALKRITTFINKKFIKYKGDLNYTCNMCMIADAILHIDTSTIVNEYDVYTEASLTPEEQKGRKEALQRAEEKKAAVKKELQDRNKTEKELYKGLKKNYSSDIQRRLLSSNEIKEMVEAVKRTSSKSEIEKLKDELNGLASNEKESFNKVLSRNMQMLKNMHESFVATNKAEQDFIQQLTIEEKKVELGEKDMEMRLELLEKFASTMGNVLNDMGNTDVFSYDNLKNSFYGTGMVATDFYAMMTSQLKTIIENVNQVKSEMDKSSKIGELLHIGAVGKEKLGEYGERLYKAHKEFDDAVFEDDMVRKELGMRSNKLVKSILFVLDQIKEESYGYTDDHAFNKQAYDSGSVIAAGLGGPFSIVKRILKGIMVGPLAGLSVGAGDVLGYGVMRKVSHATNQKRQHIVSNKEASKGKHMNRAMEGMTHEEKMGVINKSKEDLQRQYKEKELAEAKAKGR